MLVQKKQRGRFSTVTKEQAQEMLRLNNQRFTLLSIGEQYKIHQSNVTRAIQRLKDGKYDE